MLAAAPAQRQRRVLELEDRLVHDAFGEDADAPDVEFGAQQRHGDALQFEGEAIRRGSVGEGVNPALGKSLRGEAEQERRADGELGVSMEQNGHQVTGASYLLDIAG